MICSFSRTTVFISISDFTGENNQVIVWFLNKHHPNTNPFVPAIMQNVLLNVPFFWRAGIPEYAILYFFVEIEDF